MIWPGLSAEQIYGVDADGQALEPTERPGLLAEKESAARTAADATAIRFNGGFGGVV